MADRIPGGGRTKEHDEGDRTGHTEAPRPGSFPGRRFLTVYEPSPRPIFTRRTAFRGLRKRPRLPEGYAVAQVYACLNRRAMLETVLRVTTIAPWTLKQCTTTSLRGPHDHPKRRSLRPKGRAVHPPAQHDGGILLCRGKATTSGTTAPRAGRKMSRTKAIQSLNPDLLARQMITSGVFTENDPKNVLDEAPDAYKPEESIVALLPPTADILERIRPIHNIKAEEQPRPRRKRRG